MSHGTDVGKEEIIPIHGVKPDSELFGIFFRKEEGRWRSRFGEKGNFSDLPLCLRQKVGELFSQQFRFYWVGGTAIYYKDGKAIAGGGRLKLLA